MCHKHPKKMLLSTILVAWLAYMANSAEARPHYSSIVMEYPSGHILHSENVTTLNQPASLTKVMTLYLVFQALDNGELTMSQVLKVSSRAANRQPSKLGLRTKDTITVEQAICALVTKSANDAASVIAENMSPSEDIFAEKMTLQGQKLGLTHTTFKNASGIANNGQQTTALDMALLGVAMMRDFPHYYHYFALKEFTFRNHVFKTHNHLLGKYPGYDGIKTGFTLASGFNLLSSASRSGHRLIAVVLGGKTSKSRDARVVELLDTAFTNLSNLPKTQNSTQRTASSVIHSNTSSENLPPPNDYIETSNINLEINL